MVCCRVFEEFFAEHFLPVADEVSREIVGACQFAEQVAGDEQHIDGLLLAMHGDSPLDRAGEGRVHGAVDAAEAVAEVPVGGVEDLHTPVLCRGAGV